jgi:hypothetical protein
MQFVEDLLVASGFDGARELQQAIAESTLAMVDMGNDAKIAEAVYWDGLNAPFEVRLGSKVASTCAERPQSEGSKAQTTG